MGNRIKRHNLHSISTKFPENYDSSIKLEEIAKYNINKDKGIIYKQFKNINRIER